MRFRIFQVRDNGGGNFSRHALYELDAADQAAALEGAQARYPGEQLEAEQLEARATSTAGAARGGRVLGDDPAGFGRPPLVTAGGGPPANTIFDDSPPPAAAPGVVELLEGRRRGGRPGGAELLADPSTLYGELRAAGCAPDLAVILVDVLAELRARQ